VQLTDAVLELRLRARFRQHAAPDVRVEVDRLRLHPDRIGHVQRQFQKFPAHHRRERNAARVQALDVVEEIAAVTLGQVEQGKRADVHRSLGCLEMQEQPVQPA
jgi:hypothetical protein